MLSDNMQKWLDALRSGKYAQAKNQLYDGNGFCCLGIADKVCFNAYFEPGTYGGYFDDEDQSSSLSAHRARKLGLLKSVSQTEVDFVLSKYVEVESLDDSATLNRQDVLMRLNDEGYSFEEIADAIETLKWDKVTTND